MTVRWGRCRACGGLHSLGWAGAGHPSGGTLGAWIIPWHSDGVAASADRAADSHRYLLFGGARGPGKSYWLGWHGLRRLV